MRDPKQSDSPSGYCREVYQRRDALKDYEMQAAFERRIRIREVAAERARLTTGVGLHIDDTGFCPGGVI